MEHEMEPGLIQGLTRIVVPTSPASTAPSPKTMSLLQ